jgi:hypothetical protein
MGADVVGERVSVGVMMSVVVVASVDSAESVGKGVVGAAGVDEGEIGCIVQADRTKSADRMSKL